MISHRKLEVSCKMWGSCTRGSGHFQQRELLWGRGGQSKEAESMQEESKERKTQRGKASVPVHGDSGVMECHRWVRPWLPGKSAPGFGVHHGTRQHFPGSDSETGGEGDFCTVQHGGRSLRPLARQGGHGQLSCQAAAKGNRWGTYRKSSPSRGDCHELGTWAASEASQDPEHPVLSPRCGWES